MLTHVAQKLRVHQYHDCARPHDAVTNQMRFLRSALREVGVTGEIFARDIKPTGWSEVQPFCANTIWDCDLLLVHHSQGSPMLPKVLEIEVPKALVYHNITPSYFFNHDPYIRDLCQMGRAQLLQSRSQWIGTFADSHYNAHELEELGYEGVKILPLFEIASKQISKKFRKAQRLIFVGKITPHKNQVLLIKTLYYLKTLWGEKAHLTLVGGEDPIYGRYLRTLITLLGLEDSVTFPGKVDDDELSQLYRASDAFFSPSFHEGFGVPLIEAMQAGLPVFALAKAAVPETLNQSGVLIKTQKPHQIAHILSAILSDEHAVRAILEGQTARLEQLKLEQNRLKAQEAIVALLRKTRKIPSKPASTERQLDATP